MPAGHTGGGSHAPGRFAGSMRPRAGRGVGGWTLLISARRRGISGLTSVGGHMIASTSLTGARRTGPTALRVCFGSGAGTVHSAPRDQVTVAALLQDRSSCKPSPTACIGARTIPTYTLTATVSSSHLSAHTSLHAAGRPRERPSSRLRSGRGVDGARGGRGVRRDGARFI